MTFLVNSYIGGGSAGDPTDPDWASVAFLCRWEGSDAATSATEDKFGGALTFQGNAQLDTAQKKWGVSSLLLDGTGDVVLSADRSEYNIAGNDFTIEAWIRFNVLPTGASNYATIAAQWVSSLNLRSWFFAYNETSGMQFWYSTAGTSSLTVSRAWSPSTGVWYHVCVDRDGNDLRLYVDGTQLGSTADFTGVSLFNGTGSLYVGAHVVTSPTFTGFFNGWIDSVRITNGVGRYGGSFTAPTADFPTS